ncbi:MAG TPA: hypothetical protein VEC57_03790 [Candidatus Limnocylindrales bacterium]|nr:hypothetical protein [Candidatus Limnocylindrales bacterium]
MLDSEAFCRDPFLRTSAYNMATWAVVNMALSVPSYAMAAGTAWAPLSAGGYTLAFFAAGLIAGAVHERRVAKMVGPAGDAVFPAARLWAPLLLIGFGGTIFLIATGRPALVQPLWLLAVGSAYAMWGWRTRLSLYRWLGLLLLVCGAFVASLQSYEVGAAPAVLGLHVWNLTMGVASVAIAIVVNRRYLWQRA